MVNMENEALKEMMSNMDKIRSGLYKKVGQSGGSYVTATFINLETWDMISTCVRDYDYSDCSRDNDELYYMPIDKEAQHLWLRHNGIISAGDTVEVYKGRKIPVGTVAKVVRVYDWRDRYGRIQTVYAEFEDGRRTSVDNCRIVD